MKEFLEGTLYKSNAIHITVLSVITAVVILTVAFIIIKIIKRIFRKLESSGKFEYGSSYSIFLIIRYFIWLAAIITALQTIGTNMSFFLAGGAALLVGVGLGLQQLFNDIASGIVLLFEQNLKKGEIIQLENGTLGRVIHIGLRTSQIKTRENVIHVAPNSKLVNDSIINWSKIDNRTRFIVEVGVAYGSDTSKVKEILLECANHSRIQKEPPPHVRFKDFGESALIFEVLFWCTDSFTAEDIKSDIRFNIDDLFRKNNIRIPYPQRDLHIKSGILPPTS